MSIVTLLTDFGLSDAYVGTMKGVLLSVNPRIQIVDITHAVEPQDVMGACFLIEEYYPYFPDSTVHVAVVDPTVGGARRPVVIRKENHLFVGPDNGIFTLLLEGANEVYAIEDKEFMLSRVSPTFHGRDIFAPAAAHLTLGMHPSAFGRSVDDPVKLPDVSAEIASDVLTGMVVRFDRFGNAITNIRGKMLDDFLKGRPFRIVAGPVEFGEINRTYCEREFSCLIGSSGYLEFGYFQGSFRQKTAMKKGQKVEIIPA